MIHSENIDDIKNRMVYCMSHEINDNIRSNSSAIIGQKYSTARWVIRVLEQYELLS